MPKISWMRVLIQARSLEVQKGIAAHENKIRTEFQCRSETTGIYGWFHSPSQTSRNEIPLRNKAPERGKVSGRFNLLEILRLLPMKGYHHAFNRRAGHQPASSICCYRSAAMATGAMHESTKNKECSLQAAYVPGPASHQPGDDPGKRWCQHDDAGHAALTMPVTDEPAQPAGLEPAEACHRQHHTTPQIPPTPADEIGLPGPKPGSRSAGEEECGNNAAPRASHEGGCPPGIHPEGIVRAPCPACEERWARRAPVVPRHRRSSQ